MKDENFRVFPLGTGALTIEFDGGGVSVATNERVLALDAELARAPFRGFVEAVPAYASLTVYYDLIEVRRAFDELPSAFEAVAAIVRELAARAAASKKKPKPGRLIEVPVDFSGDAAPDLADVAAHAGISPADVLGIFTGREYRVYMIGFLPGFPYMGEVDPRIAAPRKRTPRTRVPQGSVGIAGVQTGIYPLESPGGWQLIGRTGFPLFDSANESEPCAFRAGDRVRFVDINK